MINFRAITEDNFDAIIRMKRPDDEHFVASNAYSLAQAWLYRDAGDVYPFAIYNDDAPVGFMMLDEDVDEKCLIIWRIMFPVENQNKGYGTAAIREIIRLAKESGKYDFLLIDYAPDNKIAEHVYTKLGFKPTGRFEHGEYELRLELK
ncbi:MAG: GNAT family N-acetyltransferase [Clostridiales bacterium]|nr:GNAT family N-acetyltransferase [Clostridiales bacterium]